MNNLKTTIGVDIGGTKIFAARYSSNGMYDAHVTLPTETREGKDHVITNILRAISEVMDDSVIAVGISWAGFVDSKKGIIMQAANIPGFSQFPLRDTLEKELHVPVVIENDARLFVYAESIMGAAHGAKNILGLIIGTGVGSGIIIDNKLYKGSQGFAGEVGHMFSSFQGDSDDEHFLCGPVLQKRFRDKGLSDVLQDHIYSWKAKEGVGYEIFEEWLTDLSKFTTNLLLAFNPEIIVFGGGIGEHVLPDMLSALTINVNKYLVHKEYPIHIDLRIAKLDNAGSMGASFLARYHT